MSESLGFCRGCGAELVRGFLDHYDEKTGQAIYRPRCSAETCRTAQCHDFCQPPPRFDKAPRSWLWGILDGPAPGPKCSKCGEPEPEWEGT